MPVLEKSYDDFATARKHADLLKRDPLTDFTGCVQPLPNFGIRL